MAPATTMRPLAAAAAADDASFEAATARDARSCKAAPDGWAYRASKSTPSYSSCARSGSSGGEGEGCSVNLDLPNSRVHGPPHLFHLESPQERWASLICQRLTRKGRTENSQETRGRGTPSIVEQNDGPYRFLIRACVRTAAGALKMLRASFASSHR